VNLLITSRNHFNEFAGAKCPWRETNTSIPAGVWEINEARMKLEEATAELEDAELEALKK